MLRRARIALIGCAPWVAIVLAVAAQEPPAATIGPADRALAEHYGFLPLEIYKLDLGIANLIAQDLNGDGRVDLAVMNNRKARIELLLQRRQSAGDAAAKASGDANVIPNDRRLEQRSIPVAKQLVGLAAGDFDHDGRRDLAYYGTPGELIVLLQDAAGQWTRRRTFEIADGTKQAWGLDAGDVNGDKLDDLTLIGENDLYVLYQRNGSPDAELAEPRKFPFSQGTMHLLRVVDFDGDGRNDVTYVAEGDEDTLRVRFQLSDGAIGPELRFNVPAQRAVAFADVDGKSGSEFLAIERQSGRLTVLGLTGGDDKESGLGLLQFFPLGKGSAGRGRGMAMGDFDGDKRPDVIVSDPASAQLLYFHQQAGGLAAPLPFPSLAGSGELRRLPRADGPDELLVLSTSEKTIAYTRLEDGRLLFPQPLPAAGEPLAFDVADIDGDGRLDVGYVSRRRGVAGGRDQLVIRWLKRDDLAWLSAGWGDAEEIALPGTTDPAGMRLLDANRDGRMDWLVLGSGPAQVLLADAAGKPVLSGSASAGLQSGLPPGALFVGDFERPAILVAQNNFARNVHISPDGRWVASDQYNAPSASAKIAAVVPCDVDGDGSPELILADATSKSLLIQQRAGAVYQPWKRLRTGSIEVKSLQTADLNGDGRQDLIVFGSDALAVSYSGSTQRKLVERANYETTIRDALLSDVVAGDLNGDGVCDIALVDRARHFLDIVQFGSDGQIRPALAFQVFESKTLGGREEAGSEPREILSADVNADDRADLILVAHDRILVYLQDAGPPAQN